MRNRQSGFGWLGLLARLALMLGLFAALGAIAEDEKNPAPAPPPPAQPANETPPAAKTTNPSADDANPVDQDDDYDKNATKRFTPSERTPADRNVSFPVDI
jgi:hypothetical protein